MPFLPKGAEWIIILIAVLLIFGPKNLPKLGSALGKTVKNLRDGMNDGKKKKKDAEQQSEDAATVVAEIEGDVDDGPGDEADGDAADEAAAESEDAGAVSAEDDGSGSVSVSGSSATVDSIKPKKTKRVVRKVSAKDASSSE